MRRQGGTQATSATTTTGGVPSIDPTWIDLPESIVVNKDLYLVIACPTSSVSSIFIVVAAIPTDLGSKHPVA